MIEAMANRVSDTSVASLRPKMSLSAAMKG